MYEKSIDYWWSWLHSSSPYKISLNNTDWDIISLDRLDYSGNLNRLDNILSNCSKKKSLE